MNPHRLYIWTPFGWNVLIGWDLDWLEGVYDAMTDFNLNTCCLVTH